jgi:hypothetical protein
VAERCFSRIKERKAAQLKRASRAREKEKQNDKGAISGQKPGSKEYSGCHGCGFKKHTKANCPKPKDKDKSKSFKNKKKDIQNFVRAGEYDSNSDGPYDVLSMQWE